MVKKKKREIRAKPRKMSISTQKKVRLAIECTPEERKYMKMFATHEDKTLNEFVLEYVRQKIFECTRSHIPNRKTSKALKDAESVKGLIHFDSIEDFLESMES